VHSFVNFQKWFQSCWIIKIHVPRRKQIKSNLCLIQKSQSMQFGYYIICWTWRWKQMTIECIHSRNFNTWNINLVSHVDICGYLTCSCLMGTNINDGGTSLFWNLYMYNGCTNTNFFNYMCLKASPPILNISQGHKLYISFPISLASIY
jgi:hypothetical protein